MVDGGGILDRQVGGDSRWYGQTAGAKDRGHGRRCEGQGGVFAASLEGLEKCDLFRDGDVANIFLQHPDVTIVVTAGKQDAAAGGVLCKLSKRGCRV